MLLLFLRAPPGSDPPFPTAITTTGRTEYDHPAPALRTAPHYFWFRILRFRAFLMCSFTILPLGPRLFAFLRYPEDGSSVRMTFGRKLFIITPSFQGLLLFGFCHACGPVEDFCC